jgi:hypothetical protein
VPVADNSGDTWVAALADDGNLYSPSDDTNGFHSAGNANIAFNRIEGTDPLKLGGTTVNTMADYGKGSEEGEDGCTWKSSGCSSIGGVIYWVVARHKYGEKSGDPHMRQTAANASIIKSSDFGRTWTPPARENYDSPTFPGRRFATPYFIEYGRGHTQVDRADQYVYAISNDGFWDNGNDMVLGRVARSKIGALVGADWEFYSGGDGLRKAAWAHNMAEAKPILERPGKLGMTGAVYLADRGRYLMVGWYYPAGGGKIAGACTKVMWDFYKSPRPWGPWTHIGFREWSPQGYYSPEVCPKFQSSSRVYLLTAGDWNNPDVYRLTLVPLDLD